MAVMYDSSDTYIRRKKKKIAILNRIELEELIYPWN